MISQGPPKGANLIIFLDAIAGRSFPRSPQICVSHWASQSPRNHTKCMVNGPRRRGLSRCAGDLFLPQGTVFVLSTMDPRENPLWCRGGSRSFDICESHDWILFGVRLLLDEHLAGDIARNPFVRFWDTTKETHWGMTPRITKVGSAERDL